VVGIIVVEKKLLVERKYIDIIKKIHIKSSLELSRKI